jgi:hypothetical protein
MLEGARKTLASEFVKNASIEYFKAQGYGDDNIIQLRITVPYSIFAEHHRNFSDYKDDIMGVVKVAQGWDIDDVIFTTDWTKLKLATLISPAETPWKEINDMQDRLLKEVKASEKTLDFMQVGLTSREMLKKLAELVYDDGKHRNFAEDRNVGSNESKNRLWAYVSYKFSNDNRSDVIDYYKAILNASDKAINLANTTTHKGTDDSFFASTCAISAITTVHIIKMIHDRQDPN